MSRDELIKLITVVGREENKRGFLVSEDIRSVEIFAGVRSVGRTEYYEALRNGIEAKLIFVVDPDDFMLSEHEIEVDGRKKKVKASRIMYEDMVYRIKRTYKNNFGMLEMTCTEVE